MKGLKSLVVSVILGGVLGLAPGAFATPQCPGVGNDCSQDTTIQGGDAHATGGTGIGMGGQGGKGGTGIGIGGEGGKGGSAKAGAAAGAAAGASLNAPISIEGDKIEVPASAPSMGAPALTAVPETCMGSTSTALTGSGGMISAGLSFGTTWKSESCERRMFARSLQALGSQYATAALALLAQDENVAKALKAAGVPIPGQAATAIPDLKLNTPLGEPKGEAPKGEPSNFGKRAQLSIPAAMAATMAERVAAVQGN